MLTTEEFCDEHHWPREWYFNGDAGCPVRYDPDTGRTVCLTWHAMSLADLTELGKCLAQPTNYASQFKAIEHELQLRSMHTITQVEIEVAL